MVILDDLMGKVLPLPDDDWVGSEELDHVLRDLVVFIAKALHTANNLGQGFLSDIEINTSAPPQP